MRRICILLFAICHSLFVPAQCINTFPHVEDFEANDGGWTSGGTGNDWAWGPVAKAVIAQAASGSNCWVTGGLTNSFYNYGERSYVQSPCFDFTSLTHPIVSFGVFWETENTYDGTTFQYSLDGGSTWTNAGGSSDTTNCMDMNWFNNFSITNLSGLANPREGWAGNVQNTSGSCRGGNGSAGWKTAQHCMPYLAGQPNVLFRFAFGAGTTCNDFDGFAFDDFSVREGLSPGLIFSYVCSADTVKFSGTTSGCLQNFAWDFGDGTTGTGILASHIYQNTGSYNVTFTAQGYCNGPASVTQAVQVFSAVASGTNVSCNGANDGKAFVTVTGAANYTYTWNTTPAQTADTAFNLPPGSYEVTVKAPGFCDAKSSVSLSEPAALQNTFAVTADTCRAMVGELLATTTGGTSPYQFAWSNGTQLNPAVNLGQNSYTLTITDANGCSLVATANVPFVSGISLLVQKQNVSCYGTNDGAITVTPSGGISPYSYTWSNNAITASINRLRAGTYLVTVADANNCNNTDSIVIEQDECASYIYFPTGFSPNGDGVNDLFKATASIDLDKYSLQVYNRWGQKVFETTDIGEGWDGKYKYTEQPISTYVWYANYSFRDGAKHSQTGNITLVR